MTELTERARRHADRAMPEWAYLSSRSWYDSGGRDHRDLARLLRALCDENDQLREALARICDAPVGPVTVGTWRDTRSDRAHGGTPC